MTKFPYVELNSLNMVLCCMYMPHPFILCSDDGHSGYFYSSAIMSSMQWTCSCRNLNKIISHFLQMLAQIGLSIICLSILIIALLESGRSPTEDSIWIPVWLTMLNISYISLFIFMLFGFFVWLVVFLFFYFCFFFFFFLRARYRPFLRSLPLQLYPKM